MHYELSINRKVLWHGVAAVTASIWGTTFISTKVLLLNGLTPEGIFLLRFALAYMLIIAVCRRPLRAATLADEGWMALAGLTGGSLYFITENTAIGLTMTSNVSLIICTAPLLTSLLARGIFGTRWGRWMPLGAIVALGGVAAVVFNGSVTLQLNPLGDFLTLAAALMWAFYSIILMKLSGRYNTLFITRKVFFYGLVSMGVYALFASPCITLEVLSRPVVIGNLLFLGIVASMACFLSWNAAVARLGATVANNYVYLTPPVTMLTSWLVLDEPITAVGLIGAAAVLLGVYLSTVQSS